MCGLLENRIQSYFSTCIGELRQDKFTVRELFLHENIEQPWRPHFQRPKAQKTAHPIVEQRSINFIPKTWPAIKSLFPTYSNVLHNPTVFLIDPGRRLFETFTLPTF